ncbi:heparan sulfate glucosamine 3-O-sulfotransferase 3B1-like [Clavelina lepadiformis]|uniref:heparan sulfate glucosamine 3-O-sulfotransferase 3B1-like n=1 Tax=Clavelina lepadiformis TaxID=159417 RepID=UPI004042DD89
MLKRVPAVVTVLLTVVFCAVFYYFNNEVCFSHRKIANIAQSTRIFKEENKKYAFFIGVKKCGTTALKTFIGLHPDIHPIYPDPHACDTPFEPFNKRLMEALTKKKYVFVADNRCMLNNEAFERYQRPSKIIVLLCDPVRRAFSDFKHFMKKGYLPPNSSFTNVVQDALNFLKNTSKDAKMWENYMKNIRQVAPFEYSIVSTGIYVMFMQEFYDRYDQQDILILSGEELRNDPGSSLEKLQTFLDVKQAITNEMFFKNRQTGFYCIRLQQYPEVCKLPRKTNEPTLSADKESINNLKEFYKKYNKQLFNLTRREFKWL